MRHALPLLLVLTAATGCRRDHDHDTPPTGVTVIALGARTGAPAEGMRIAISDATGAVVDVVSTESDGTATLSVPDGGSITALDPPPDASSHAWTLQTVIEPPLGVLIPFSKSEAPASESALQVTLTSYPPSTAWSWSAECAGGGARVDQDTFSTSCPAGGTSDFYAIAFGGSGGALAWGRTDDVALTAGAVPVTIALTSTTFDLTTISVILPPALDGSKFVYFDVTAREGDTPLPVSENLTNTLQVGGTIEKDIRSPDAAGVSSWISAVSIAKLFDGIHLEIASTTPPVTPAFDASPVPFLSDLALDTADPVHPALSWSATAGARGTLGTAVIPFTKGASSTSWRVRYAPVGVTALVMPDLPAEFAEAAPDATADFDLTTVDETSVDSVLGYAQSLVTPMELTTSGTLYRASTGVAP